MNIGKLKLKGNLILAPMSFVTNLPFRLICKKYGAALVYSEMTFSEAILRQNQKSLNRVHTTNDERPVGIQLLGSNPDSVINSARIIEQKFHPELMDVNFGCPSQNIVKNECGAALLKKPEVIGEIISGLRGFLEVPITAKIRILNSIDETLEIAHTIEKAGADALTVHGRTQKQQYSGKSNLEFIKKIKSELSIPVIANGDIFDEKTAKYVIEYTQCDGLMIGRAAIGDPHIFRRIAYYLDDMDFLSIQTQTERMDDFFEYESLCMRFEMLEFRDYVAKALWFTKGMKNIKPTRVEINNAKDIDSIRRIMERLRCLYD
jgi:tRNA-dihydrouridine synthase B